MKYKESKAEGGSLDKPKIITKRHEDAKRKEAKNSIEPMVVEASERVLESRVGIVGTGENRGGKEAYHQPHSKTPSRRLYKLVNAAEG